MYDIKPVTSTKSTVCGPVSLKMLLAFYGHEADLDALITECGVGVAGCSAADVLRVGRAHGLADMATYREDAEALYRQDRPAILWWHYNHFVVYCGLDANGEPIIANPIRGRYAIDRGTFESLYSGIALINGQPSDIMPEDYFGEIEPESDYWNE